MKHRTQPPNMHSARTVYARIQCHASELRALYYAMAWKTGVCVACIQLGDLEYAARS